MDVEGFIHSLKAKETILILGKVLGIPLKQYRLTSARKKKIMDEYKSDPEKLLRILKSYTGRKRELGDVQTTPALSTVQREYNKLKKMTGKGVGGARQIYTPAQIFQIWGIYVQYGMTFPELIAFVRSQQNDPLPEDESEPYDVDYSNPNEVLSPTRLEREFGFFAIRTPLKVREALRFQEIENGQGAPSNLLEKLFLQNYFKPVMTLSFWKKLKQRYKTEGDDMFNEMLKRRREDRDRDDHDDQDGGGKDKRLAQEIPI